MVIKPIGFCLSVILLFAITGCARVYIPLAPSGASPSAATPNVAGPIPLGVTPTADKAGVLGGLAGVGQATPNGATPTDQGATAGLPALTYDRNPNALLIEADICCGEGAVPIDVHVPIFRLYADGLVLYAGDSTPLSSGLDAAVVMGHLYDGQIQDLLAYLGQTGFFSLNASYQPQPKPKGLPTAHINVYLSRAKTVEVYGPGVGPTPEAFSKSLDRIKQTVPAEASRFIPTQARLEAVSVGGASDYRAAVDLEPWPSDIGLRLSDALDGIDLSGKSFTTVAGLVAQALPTELYREGDRVYRVRFMPKLPRSVALTDWVGAIDEAPREFEGRVVDIVGYYRGANLYGEAKGRALSSRDWVIKDETGAMFVTGGVPRGLDPSSRSDLWTVLRLRAVVVYVRLGVSHLEARRIDSDSGEALMLTTRPSPTSEPEPVWTPQLLVP